MWRELVLVVPCYNEAERFRADAFAAALAEDDALRLLFVDDGSSDATAEVLQAFVASHPAACGFYAMPQNAGKAEAVRAGVHAVAQRFPDADFVGYWDADLATPFEALDDFRTALRRAPDATFLLGARVRLMGRAIRRKPSRHLLGRVFATCASAVVNLPVYDTQCGAKIIRADVARAIFDAPFSSRWIFDVELLARLSALEGRDAALRQIVEVPLTAWDDVEGSKVKGRDFFRAALDLGKIYRRKRR